MTFRTPALLAAASTLALAACQPGPAGTNTQTGAITGAILGGAIGAASGDDVEVENVAAGAVLGGLVGGAIGSNLDRQAAELEQAVVNDRVRIVNTGSQLIVTLPEGILFATDSAAVNPAIQGDLYAVAANLNRYPNSRVEVIGHTDNTGAAAYNQDLSQRRAGAVAAILRNGGVAPSRLVAFGRGEDAPVASNLTPEGRQQNRRVEIIIIPNG
jgi:outer membrane protein OmpA-like peptidoglycan-associated protein